MYDNNIYFFRRDIPFNLMATNVTVKGGGHFVTKGCLTMEAEHQVAIYSGGNINLDHGGYFI